MRAVRSGTRVGLFWAVNTRSFATARSPFDSPALERERHVDRARAASSAAALLQEPGASADMFAGRRGARLATRRQTRYARSRLRSPGRQTLTGFDPSRPARGAPARCPQKRSSKAWGTRERSVRGYALGLGDWPPEPRSKFLGFVVLLAPPASPDVMAQEHVEKLLPSVLKSVTTQIQSESDATRHHGRRHQAAH